jgi:hypothetical protein
MWGSKVKIILNNMWTELINPVTDASVLVAQEISKTVELLSAALSNSSNRSICIYKQIKTFGQMWKFGSGFNTF